MTYENYKQLLTVQGMSCMARYMGTGVETGCHMFNINNGLNVEITMDGERVLANASVVIPGLINPVSTGKFSQPWSNQAFINQCKRLTRMKHLLGESLKEEQS